MRKPKYTTDGAWRIVSVPNGLWRLQEYSNHKGLNAYPATKNGPGQAHCDPWSNRSPAVGLQEARELLAVRQPQKAEEGGCGMTHYEYICQRWPNHAQRIIEETYRLDRAGAEYFMLRPVREGDSVLCHLFVWSGTPEGYRYWKALVAGESVEVQR